MKLISLILEYINYLNSNESYITPYCQTNISIRIIKSFKINAQFKRTSALEYMLGESNILMFHCFRLQKIL